MTNEQKGGEAGGITAEQRSRRDMQELYDVHSYEVRRYGVCGRVLLDRVGQATPHDIGPHLLFTIRERRGDFILGGHFENNKGGVWDTLAIWR